MGPVEERPLRLQPEPLAKPDRETVFSSRRDIEVASAGTNHDADTPLTHDLVSWADIIFVMEKAHRAKLQKKFKASLKKARVICLDIPDDYEFMDPGLVRLLEARVSKYLG
ncbi:Protein-tyrosine-phosphatase [Mesorhizobium ventifaucium]|uniref:Protein-tyrosine-phosphatase n=1 Tax=Mesorhizobium ventifaucium TaxID=666020 RepID=A0ABN8JNG1_9HYPH|nr:Protein-tyrosine-phosphatase [Mesorhizobium ventifaucium]